MRNARQCIVLQQTNAGNGRLKFRQKLCYTGSNIGSGGLRIQDHLLLYHTDMGRIEAWGKLSDVEAELDAYNFARCSSAHLVNMQHITSVSKTEVIVGSTKLPISQRKRKAFCDRVIAYLNKTS